MKNMIYRGHIENQPRSVNLLVAAALLPGLMVTANANNELELATTAADIRPFVLSNMEFSDQTIEKAYTAGDTGVAYEINPNDKFYVRLAAATYAANTPLTIGAGGYLTAAAAGDRVVAHFEDTPGVFTAGQFADVVFVNNYRKA